MTRGSNKARSSNNRPTFVWMRRRQSAEGYGHITPPYDKMADYYKDEPNVEVIIDRRRAERRRRGETAGGKREIRDRRRRRAAGSFPEIDVA